MKKIVPGMISVVAVVIGIIFAVSGIDTIKNKDLYDTQITATIVDVEEEWQSAADPDDPDTLVKTAYIDYEFDGVKYERVLSPEQNDKLKVGDTVEILVQSKNHEKISGPDPLKSGIIVTVLGALVAAVGLVSAIKLFKKKEEEN